MIHIVRLRISKFLLNCDEKSFWCLKIHQNHANLVDILKIPAYKKIVHKTWNIVLTTFTTYTDCQKSLLKNIYTSLTLRSIIIDVTQMMVTGIKNPSVTRYQAYDWCVGSCHDGAQLKKWKSFCLTRRFHPRCLLTNDYLGPFYLENCSKYFGFTESSKYKSFSIICLNRSYSYDNSLVHQKC